MDGDDDCDDANEPAADPSGDGDDGMYEVVYLERLARPTDLWPAVESAQFARIIIYEAVTSDDDERAIEEFVDAFAALVDAWEANHGRNRAFMFDGVSEHLRELERKGLFVHLGSIERSLGQAVAGEATVVPVAVIRIGRSSLASTTTRLPCELALTSAEGVRPH